MVLQTPTPSLAVSLSLFPLYHSLHLAYALQVFVRVVCVWGCMCLCRVCVVVC
jgi:hypothetical protein